jgi:hypothetical protein
MVRSDPDEVRLEVAVGDAGVASDEVVKSVLTTGKAFDRRRSSPTS